MDSLAAEDPDRGRWLLRWMRRGFNVAIVLAVIAGLCVGYLWLAAGQMRKLEPLLPLGDCVQVEAPGAEDIEVHRGEALAFVSSDDRAAGADRQGAIFGYALRGERELSDLTASTGLSLRPHGIFLVEGVASSQLYVVNHAPAGDSAEGAGPGGGEVTHSVEIFDWWKGRLEHRQTVRDPLLVSPNDVAALEDGRFWVTNDHGSGSAAGQLFEDFLRLGRGNVVFWDGSEMRVVAEDIAYANGIQVNSDGSEVYVASTTTGKILRYQAQASGNLELIEEIALATGVDNLEIDLHGSMWVAAHPHLMSFLSHARDPGKRSPSEGLWVSPEAPYDPDAPRARPVFLTLGEEISGSSVVVPFGSRLLIGSVFEPFFLVCER